MISFKKALCALSLGIGLSTSLNVWAVKADCALCEAWRDKCEAGDEHSCFLWDYNYCGIVIATTCPP